MSAHLITEAELDANPWASCGPIALAGLLGRPLSPRGDAATEAEERGEREDLDGWKAIGDYDTSGMDLPDDH